MFPFHHRALRSRATIAKLRTRIALLLPEEDVESVAAPEATYTCSSSYTVFVRSRKYLVLDVYAGEDTTVDDINPALP